MLTDDQLIEISNKVAHAVKKRTHCSLSLSDLLNEAFLAAKQHDRTVEYAAFWAYKMAKRLIVSSQYNSPEQRALRANYKPPTSSPIATTTLENIIDLCEVSAHCLNSYEKVLLYERYVEGKEVTAIANYYHKDKAEVSRVITNAHAKLKGKLK